MAALRHALLALCIWAMANFCLAASIRKLQDNKNNQEVGELTENTLMDGKVVDRSVQYVIPLAFELALVVYRWIPCLVFVVCI